jgi:hypothetical protein
MATVESDIFEIRVGSEDFSKPFFSGEFVVKNMNALQVFVP